MTTTQTARIHHSLGQQELLSKVATLALILLLSPALLVAEQVAAFEPVHEIETTARGTEIHRELVPHPEDATRQVEFYWVQPKGEGPWPAIIYVHGHQHPERPGARAYVNSPVLVRMAHRGLLAVAISQPGYGASDGPPDFCGPYTQAAVREVLRLLRAKKGISDGRLVLYGYSRGAIVSSMVAIEEPQMAGLILGAGAYDVGDQYAQLEGNEEMQGLRQNIERETGLTEQALRVRSALGQGSKIRAPTLILHGTEDETCPVEQAKSLAREIRSAGTEVHLRLFPETGHHIPFKERNNAIYEFLERVLDL